MAVPSTTDTGRGLVFEDSADNLKIQHDGPDYFTNNIDLRGTVGPPGTGILTGTITLFGSGSFDVKLGNGTENVIFTNTGDGFGIPAYNGNATLRDVDSSINALSGVYTFTNSAINGATATKTFDIENGTETALFAGATFAVFNGSPDLVLNSPNGSVFMHDFQATEFHSISGTSSNNNVRFDDYLPSSDAHFHGSTHGLNIIDATLLAPGELVTIDALNSGTSSAVQPNATKILLDDSNIFLGGASFGSAYVVAGNATALTTNQSTYG